MLELIVAVDEKYGIGKQNKLPWTCPSELKHFKHVTANSTLIMGRKTCEYLPHLKNREILCMSKHKLIDTTGFKNHIDVIADFDIDEYQCNKYFIAGGAEIYNYFMNHEKYRNKIKIHMSVINGCYDCDTYFDTELLKGYVITNKQRYDDFTYLILEYDDQENQYLNICNKILKNGNVRTGRNGEVKSLFNDHMTFDLTKGFPLLTTKKMFFRGIVEELLFFIRGDTDTTMLSDKKVKIWEGNTSREFLRHKKLNYSTGVMGPMYGYQWRYFNSPYVLDENRKPLTPTEGIDQLKQVVELINNEPTSRRILLTSYNPSQSNEGVLYPCHSLMIQFYVDGDYLDMFCYNRSQDFFLGTPYNITSSSILLIIVAKITNKIPRHLNITMGDIHIYKEHYNAVETQLKNIAYKFPSLNIDKNISSVESLNSLTFGDFKLENYHSNDSIKAEMKS